MWVVLAVDFALIAVHPVAGVPVLPLRAHFSHGDSQQRLALKHTAVSSPPLCKAPFWVRGEEFRVVQGVLLECELSPAAGAWYAASCLCVRRAAWPRPAPLLPQGALLSATLEVEFDRRLWCR